MDVRISVKDIMSAPVITVNIKDKIDRTASLMRTKRVGSVVVLDDNSKPVGVITERDMVEKVVSKNLMPKDVRAEEIMSEPLHTVDPAISILEASRLMRNLGIRRLIVVKDGHLVGLVSSDDVIRVTPEMITIIMEESRIGRLSKLLKKSSKMGRCESCSNWSSDLVEYEGQFICEECSS